MTSELGIDIELLKTRWTLGAVAESVESTVASLASWKLGVWFPVESNQCRIKLIHVAS